MSKRIALTLLVHFAACVSILAQVAQVYGRVTYGGQPVSMANVVEMDANHRILNHTKTDAAGLFNMKVTSGKTALRVTCNGMRRFTHKIGSQQEWNICLEKESAHEAQKQVKARHETSNLIAGHLKGRVVPQLTWVEQLNDTTFTIIVPVRVVNMVEEYPAGRNLAVQDYNGHIVALGVCIETATAKQGAPQSYDPYIRPTNNTSADNASSFTGDESDYFCYPRFRLSKTELEYLIDHSTELACFAVDTSRGDNYWMFYPTPGFAKEMQKIINKMLK
ncbi:MAG: carboxypeptidase-like regulatory domain-containing protein [Bacteroidaceae bacterium]|nr:carboxypeptidase-like regulatory domain-containing protein [Bacteroidaceae bacterium]